MMEILKKCKFFSCLLFLLQVLFVTQSINAEDNKPLKQKLTPLEERKLDYFFYEGLILKNAEKFDAAYEMFRYCLTIDSTSSAALHELASYFIQLDQPEKAVSLMRRAIRYAPDNLEYRITFATLLFNLGLFSDAAEEYKILAGINPEKPELSYYLAESYTRMGEKGKAIEMYNEIENIMGIHESLSMQKYQLYMSLQQPENAFNEIKKLADHYPMESRYPIILGDLYLQQNNHTQALSYFQKAIEIDPESPYYPVSMANYYEQTGQRDSAEQQINHALVNDQLDVNTKLSILARYIVQLQRSKQDMEGVNTMFQKLLEQHPEETRLRLIYGEYLSAQSKFEEARFQVRIVTESEPENMEAWRQLLVLAFQMQDYEEAVEISKKCREIFPDEMEFIRLLGIAYFQNKDFQSAIETYQSAIENIPVGGDAMLLSFFYGQMGDTYFRMKETDKAFNAYEEALKYNDKNIVVLNNYAYYLSLMKKDLAKAERMSALTMKMEPDNSTYIDTYAWVFFVQGNLILAKIYIEQAISKDKTNSAELTDHYGDILYLLGEKEKAVEQWEKARELGKKTATLDKKITEKTYFEATEEELLNDPDEDTTD